MPSSSPPLFLRARSMPKPCFRRNNFWRVNPVKQNTQVQMWPTQKHFSLPLPSLSYHPFIFKKKFSTCAASNNSFSQGFSNWVVFFVRIRKPLFNFLCLFESGLVGVCFWVVCLLPAFCLSSWFNSIVKNTWTILLFQPPKPFFFFFLKHRFDPWSKFGKTGLSHWISFRPHFQRTANHSHTFH